MSAGRSASRCAARSPISDPGHLPAAGLGKLVRLSDSRRSTFRNGEICPCSRPSVARATFVPHHARVTCSWSNNRGVPETWTKELTAPTDTPSGCASRNCGKDSPGRRNIRAPPPGRDLNLQRRAPLGDSPAQRKMIRSNVSVGTAKSFAGGRARWTDLRNSNYVGAWRPLGRLRRRPVTHRRPYRKPALLKAPPIRTAQSADDAPEHRSIGARRSAIIRLAGWGAGSNADARVAGGRRCPRW